MRRTYLEKEKTPPRVRGGVRMSDQLASKNLVRVRQGLTP
jgi:hypothetical protein